MTYRIADGHNNEPEFADVSPQPRCPGLLYTRRVNSLNRTIYEDGVYTYWEFTALTDAQYASLLTQFGLSESTKTNQVTIRTRDNTRQLVNKNGTIALPQQGQDASRQMAFYRDVRFYITELSDT